MEEYNSPLGKHTKHQMIYKHMQDNLLSYEELSIKIGINQLTLPKMGSYPRWGQVLKYKVPPYMNVNTTPG